ncbi:glycosyltransferase family 4 protein [Ideonella livida]|uniref:Glycosyltransferase family 4 protein n=1 Tax=Ideonella livida TaxID=2707176 RepID=A0A7C9PJB5_9BURK|nr:glycosyltransferase family 1 protein [Ideonella livida]NDY93415.1 glycosyltransferase family 4 protein [Ideonella livida]
MTVHILLELRPALGGHAGIPQETRLLFRGLAALPGLQVDGLLQSSNRLLPPALPPVATRWREDRKVHRLSRVVIALQDTNDRGRFQRAADALRLALAGVRLQLRTAVGLRTALDRFEPRHFSDFLWRGLFAKTLPAEDLAQVAGAGYRVVRMPWVGLHSAALATRPLGGALYPRFDTRGVDVLLAETPFPGRVSAGTRLVVRYHDAIPLLMPHTISAPTWHQASHYHALRRNVRDGAWFACVSESTRRDLVSLFPQAEARAVTLPNMVSPHYFPEDSPADRIPDILRLRRNTQLADGAAPFALQRGPGGVDYLLMVSTIEPRKNHLSLLAAWEQLRHAGHPQLQLVLVGMMGWHAKAIVAKFRPWLARGGLHVLEDVPAAELRLLYRHARATVCPSFGEGFDFSGIEAMRCGGVVAASDIPVHRDVFADGCELFHPYDVSDQVRCLQRLLAPEAQVLRQALVARGDTVARRYLPEVLLPRWQDFLQQVVRGAT